MTEIIHDVFISHAVEDKNAFTNELAVELKKRGLKVWYSGSDLKIGDSIMTGVNKALLSSRFAVVVISPAYIRKNWAMAELEAFFSKEEGHKRILPILHRITIDEIKGQLLLMADRYAISSDKGLEFIVGKILEVVKEESDHAISDMHAENIKKKIPGRIHSPIPALSLLEIPPVLLQKLLPALKNIFTKPGRKEIFSLPELLLSFYACWGIT